MISGDPWEKVIQPLKGWESLIQITITYLEACLTSNSTSCQVDNINYHDEHMVLQVSERSRYVGLALNGVHAVHMCVAPQKEASSVFLIPSFFSC